MGTCTTETCEPKNEETSIDKSMMVHGDFSGKRMSVGTSITFVRCSWPPFPINSWCVSKSHVGVFTNARVCSAQSKPWSLHHFRDVVLCGSCRRQSPTLLSWRGGRRRLMQSPVTRGRAPCSTVSWCTQKTKSILHETFLRASHAFGAIGITVALFRAGVGHITCDLLSCGHARAASAPICSREVGRRKYVEHLFSTTSCQIPVNP